MKEKKYSVIVFEPNLTLTEAITRLVAAAAEGKFVCGDFCGVRLYSDTVSFDSAFKQIAGQSYYATLAKRDEADEATMQRYIFLGHQLVLKKLWPNWDNYVRDSIAGEYHGSDIACALAIMDALLKNGKQSALAVLQKQTHNKYTLSLVLSVIKSFCVGGTEFVDYVKSYYGSH